MNDEERKARLATALKWGLGLGAAVLIAPIVFLAVKGIVGLGLAVLAGLVIINLAPVVSLRLATWRIQGLKGIARNSPIETREKLALDKHAALKKMSESITAYATEVNNFASEVRDLAKQYPDEAAEFENKLQKCMSLLQLQRMKYREAVSALAGFEAATERAKMKWKVAQSAIRMERLSGQQAQSAMDKILADEALDSVESAMNQAFAGLDTSIMEIEATRAAPALPHSQHDVIELTPTKVKEVSR